MTGSSVKLAGEGAADLAVLRRLALDAGFDPRDADQYGRRGKGFMDKRINSYNQAAAREPWIALRDMDHDAPCAAGLARLILPNPERLMVFRIVVRAVEA